MKQGKNNLCLHNGTNLIIARAYKAGQEYLQNTIRKNCMWCEVNNNVKSLKVMLTKLFSLHTDNSRGRNKKKIFSSNWPEKETNLLNNWFRISGMKVVICAVYVNSILKRFIFWCDEKLSPFSILNPPCDIFLYSGS